MAKKRWRTRFKMRLVLENQVEDLMLTLCDLARTRTGNFEDGGD